MSTLTQFFGGGTVLGEIRQLPYVNRVFAPGALDNYPDNFSPLLTNGGETWILGGTAITYTTDYAEFVTACPGGGREVFTNEFGAATTANMAFYGANVYLDHNGSSYYTGVDVQTGGGFRRSDGLSAPWTTVSVLSGNPPGGVVSDPLALLHTAKFRVKSGTFAHRAIWLEYGSVSSSGKDGTGATFRARWAPSNETVGSATFGTEYQVAALTNAPNMTPSCLVGNTSGSKLVAILSGGYTANAQPLTSASVWTSSDFGSTWTNRSASINTMGNVINSAFFSNVLNKFLYTNNPAGANHGARTTTLYSATDGYSIVTEASNMLIGYNTNILEFGKVGEGFKFAENATAVIHLGGSITESTTLASVPLRYKTVIYRASATGGWVAVTAPTTFLVAVGGTSNNFWALGFNYQPVGGAYYNLYYSNNNGDTWTRINNNWIYRINTQTINGTVTSTGSTSTIGWTVADQQLMLNIGWVGLFIANNVLFFVCKSNLGNSLATYYRLGDLNNLLPTSLGPPDLVFPGVPSNNTSANTSDYIRIK